MSIELLDIETITDLTTQLFCSLFGDEALLPAPGALSALAETAIVASVDIAGDNPASVEVACSLPFAHEVAASMFALPEDELDERSVHDAVGELVNIIGGNVKSLLEGATTLTLPFLRAEALGTADGPACAAGFAWRGQPLAVRITERAPVSA
jgi:chemotaxis protein CheX